MAEKKFDAMNIKPVHDRFSPLTRSIIIDCVSIANLKTTYIMLVVYNVRRTRVGEPSFSVFLLRM